MRLRTTNTRRKNKLYGSKVWRLKIGKIYHACSMHAVRVTELDSCSVYGVSVLDGSYGHGCSLRHCAPYVMTSREIRETKAAWKRDGERGIIAQYYGGGPQAEEAADQFMKVWR